MPTAQQYHLGSASTGKLTSLELITPASPKTPAAYIIESTVAHFFTHTNHVPLCCAFYAEAIQRDRRLRRQLEALSSTLDELNGQQGTAWACLPLPVYACLREAQLLPLIMVLLANKQLKELGERGGLYFEVGWYWVQGAGCCITRV